MLLRLKPLYREVVVLRHYEELKFHEIAELLGIPRGTVASRMAAALKMLGDQLHEPGVTPPETKVSKMKGTRHETLY